MYLHTEKTETVFRKVKYVQEHRDSMFLSKDCLPVSVDDLKAAVSDMYGLKIGIREVMFTGNFLRSAVERYNNQHAMIYVKHDLSKDLKRFAATKELMHLVIDEKEDWSVDGVSTISSFLIESSLSDNGGKIANNQAQSEKLAEFAAIEVLYPYKFRELDKEKLISQPNLLNKLSLEYEVPVFMIGRALSDWYVRIADQMWSEVNRPKDG